MLHPSTELRFIDDVIGYGVVATAFIPKGTITWALDELDIQLDPDRIAGMDPNQQKYLEKYAYMDGRGLYILCWDHARFVNHHCEANCLGGGYDFEIAVRDIHPGEQLTDDYGGLNVEAPFGCACGSPKCRGTVRPDDILRLSDEWDAKLTEAFAVMSTVDQKLWPVLRNQQAVRDVLEGRARMNSSRNHYWAGVQAK